MMPEIPTLYLLSFVYCWRATKRQHCCFYSKIPSVLLVLCFLFIGNRINNKQISLFNFSSSATSSSSSAINMLMIRCCWWVTWCEWVDSVSLICTLLAIGIWFRFFSLVSCFEKDMQSFLRLLPPLRLQILPISDTFPFCQQRHTAHRDAPVPAQSLCTCNGMSFCWIPSIEMEEEKKQQQQRSRDQESIQFIPRIYLVLSPSSCLLLLLSGCCTSSFGCR